MASILGKYISKTEFSSYEDFIENYAVDAPDTFNFGFDVVDAWADAEPGKLALWWLDDNGNERRLTFGEMKALSNKAANLFVDLGVKKGDFVMLVLMQRCEYWICAAALHKIGAVVVPATAQLTRKDIIYRNNAADISIIVALASDRRLFGDICSSLSESPTVRHVVCVDKSCVARDSCVAREPGDSCCPGGESGLGNKIVDFDAFIERQPDTYERPVGGSAAATRIGDPFLMYFTSGTTGMPKMVMHDGSYPLGHITTAKYWQHACDGALHLTVADSGWAKFGWGKIYGQWLCGAAIFAYDYVRFSPVKMLEVMQNYPITTYCAPPTTFRFLTQEDVRSYDLSSIVRYTAAGEPLNPEVQRKWKAMTGAEIVEGFGQTESSVLLANFDWYPPKPGSMGKPSPLYDMAIVDEEYNECDEGIEGRVVVRGVDRRSPPGLLKYYYRDDALNSEAFQNGCYSTGDIAWKDPDGYYFFVGRNDDIIKSSGYRIGPFEVESALLEHNAVVECAVTAAPDPIRGQVIKATIVLARGYAAECAADGDAEAALKKELQDHVKRVTAPYKYPRIIEFVSELPKSIGGKIKRGDIRNRDASR